MKWSRSPLNYSFRLISKFGCLQGTSKRLPLILVRFIVKILVILIQHRLCVLAVNRHDDNFNNKFCHCWRYRQAAQWSSPKERKRGSYCIISNVKMPLFLTTIQGEYGLVIDGHTLLFALDVDRSKRLLQLGQRCKAVICCRVSPLQKVSTAR